MNLHIDKSGVGTPVLFIHGASGSGLNWYYQKEYLKTIARVLLVDLPGHGASEGDGCKSIEACRDVCYRALLSEGAAPAILVGHSMGGAIAISLALSYPDAVKALILVGTGARLRVLPGILDRMLQDKEGVIRMIAEYAFSPKTSARTKEAAVSEMMKCRAEVIYNDFFACDRFDAMGSLGDLHIPTLIICGKDDRLTPPAYSEYLHREIAGSELLLVEDAGHIVMLEKPDPVNEGIARFLKQFQG